MSISINSVYKFIEKKFLKGFFDNLIKSSKKKNILNKKKTLRTLFLSNLAINKLTANIISNSHQNIKTLKLILIYFILRTEIEMKKWLRQKTQHN